MSPNPREEVTMIEDNATNEIQEIVEDLRAKNMGFSRWESSAELKRLSEKPNALEAANKSNDNSFIDTEAIANEFPRLKDDYTSLCEDASLDSFAFPVNHMFQVKSSQTKSNSNNAGFARLEGLAELKEELAELKERTLAQSFRTKIIANKFPEPKNASISWHDDESIDSFAFSSDMVSQVKTSARNLELARLESCVKLERLSEKPNTMENAKKGEAIALKSGIALSQSVGRKSATNKLPKLKNDDVFQFDEESIGSFALPSDMVPDVKSTQIKITSQNAGFARLEGISELGRPSFAQSIDTEAIAKESSKLKYNFTPRRDEESIDSFMLPSNIVFQGESIQTKKTVKSTEFAKLEGIAELKRLAAKSITEWVTDLSLSDGTKTISNESSKVKDNSMSQWDDESIAPFAFSVDAVPQFNSIRIKTMSPDFIAPRNKLSHKSTYINEENLRYAQSQILDQKHNQVFNENDEEKEYDKFSEILDDVNTVNLETKLLQASNGDDEEKKYDEFDELLHDENIVNLQTKSICSQKGILLSGHIEYRSPNSSFRNSSAKEATAVHHNQFSPSKTADDTMLNGKQLVNTQMSAAKPFQMMDPLSSFLPEKEIASPTLQYHKSPHSAAYDVNQFDPRDPFILPAPHNSPPSINRKEYIRRHARSSHPLSRRSGKSIKKTSPSSKSHRPVTSASANPQSLTIGHTHNDVVTHESSELIQSSKLPSEALQSMLMQIEYTTMQMADAQDDEKEKLANMVKNLSSAAITLKKLEAL